MYYIFALCVGALSALQTTFNGKICGALGMYTGTVVVHLVGLVAWVILLAFRRERVRLFGEGLPWYRYLGGVVGVSTVVASSYSYTSHLGVTQIVGLSLTGSAVMSLLVDGFGWFGMKKRRQSPLKLPGLALMVCGIVFMLRPFSSFSGVAVLAALLCGMTAVISRSFNGTLNELIGPSKTTLYNYVTGILTAVAVMLLIGRGEPAWTGTPLPANIWWYTGGLFGMIAVTLLNVTVRRIPALYLTILQFIAQVAAGMAIDAVSGTPVSVTKMVGALFCAAGMLVNMQADRLMEEKNK